MCTKPPKKVRKSHWMNIIQQWSASGLTKTEWCRRNNVSPKSFFYWQRQLRQEAYCQHIEQNAAVAVTAAAKPAARPVFAEVPIPDHSSSQVQQASPFGFQPDAIFQTNCMSIAVSGRTSGELLDMIRSVIDHAS